MTSHRTTIHLKSLPVKNMDPSNINIIRQFTCSDSSAIFEVEFDRQKYALKLFHDNGDPRYTENGRELNRFCCESNAYQK